MTFYQGGAGAHLATITVAPTGSSRLYRRLVTSDWSALLAGDWERLRQTNEQDVQKSRFFGSIDRSRRMTTDSTRQFGDPSAAQQRFLSLFLRSEREVFRYVEGQAKPEVA